MEMKTVYTLREKPEWVTEQQRAGRTLILAAARPIYGHAVENSWNMPFIHGRHFAAIDPTASDAQEKITESARLDAAQIVFLTEDEAFEMGCEWYRTERPRIWKTIEEKGADEWRAEIIKGFIRHVND